MSGLPAARRWWCWDKVRCALSLAAVVCWASHCTAADVASLDALVSELTAEAPWYYRLIDENAGPGSQIPNALVRKAVQEDTQAAQRRRAAAAKLKLLGTNAWSAIPALVDALRLANPSVTVAAADVLGGIQGDRAPLWPNVAHRVFNETNAAKALCWILRGHNESMRPYGASQRRFALIGLGTVGPAARMATQDVAEVLLAREQSELWPVALSALLKIGADASATIAHLRATLRDTNEWPAVSAAAALTLARAKPDSQLMDALRETLRDPRSMVRIGAAQALWRLGAPADEVLPVLIDGTRHKLASIRLIALETIAEAGPGAQPAASAVRTLLSDEDQRVQAAAQRTLGSISTTVRR